MTAQTNHLAYIQRLDTARHLTEFEDIWSEATHIGPTDDGRAPGVSWDAPAGTYINGYHIITKGSADDGSDIHVTAIHDLPEHAHKLWVDHENSELWVKRVAANALKSREDERRRRGRPEIGRPIQVRLPDWQLKIIDEFSDRHLPPLARADAIRQLIRLGLQTVRERGLTLTLEESQGAEQLQRDLLAGGISGAFPVVDTNTPEEDA